MGPIEMRKDMRACTQEHAPECTATCPLHVDARGLWRSLRDGDFDAALESYQRTVLFPRLVGAFCPAPCQERCAKNRAGQAVAIRALEESLPRFGSAPLLAFTPFLQMEKRVAVVGGGISGLAAAVFLYEKGFQVSIYEAAPRLGGAGWLLDEESARQDFAFLGAIPWQVNLGHRVDDLAPLLEEYDGVYLSGDAAPAADFDFDAATGQCQTQPKLFAGGGLLRPEQAYSILDSLFTGRRAALSMDRRLKGVSLSAGRQHEGSYATELFTGVGEEVPRDEAVPPSLPWTGGGQAAPGFPTPPAALYTREEAMAEAARCMDCQCLQCVRQCTYLQHYKSYPYAAILEMATHIRMIGGQRQAGPLINSCSLCGLCGEICPNGIQMAKSVHSARQYLVDKGQNVPAVHDFPLRDMEFSNGEGFALWSHAPGQAESRYLFFPGCQLAAVLPELMAPTYEYLLEKLGAQVGLGLGCCGAPAHWSGYEKRYQEGMDAFMEHWCRLGKPEIVAACPTCQKQMGDFSPELPVTSLWQVFARHGLPRGAGGIRPALAVQDACGSRHMPNLQNAVRSLLRQIDCPVRELDYSREKTKCCNYGGLMTYGNPQLAKQALVQRLGESGEDFLVYCGACREQCQRGGKTTWHLLELLFGRPCAPVLDVTEKRENRLWVKNDFLRRFWPQFPTVSRQKSGLLIAPAVRRLLDERRILVEELGQVVGTARATGRQLRNPKTGRYTAHLQLGCATCWVEYAPEEEGVRVYNAYTHRLQIVDD